VTTVRIVGGLEATFAWDGANLYRAADLAPDREHPSFLRGAAATVSASAGRDRWRIVRGPLGLNKLFWVARPDGELMFTARPWRLVELGHRLDEIAAVPRCLVLDLDPAEREPCATSLVPEARSAPSSPDIDVRTAGREIREHLDRYVGAIAARHRGAPVFVCLPGESTARASPLSLRITSRTPS
jgi:hypothetical protein